MKQINSSSFVYRVANACFIFIVFSLISQAFAENVVVKGESLVLSGVESGSLSFQEIKHHSISIRNLFDIADPNLVWYKEGPDYLVDYKEGTISRAKDSTIPDFSKSPSYGKKDFRSEDIPHIGNKLFFIYVDYETLDGFKWAEPNNQKKYLLNTRKKLEIGGNFKIATYGDSITAGGGASKYEFIFTQRYAQFLRKNFPKSNIILEDYSIPGYTTTEGRAWFNQKPDGIKGPAIGSVKNPDLILIGFGMNDHNLGGATPEQFESNLIKIVGLARASGADVVLFSSFSPNENWYYGTHRMSQYAQATRDAALKTHSAYVDVFHVWSKVLERKDQSSLLENDINHPNDFGHWLYEQAFEAMLF